MLGYFSETIYCSCLALWYCGVEAQLKAYSAWLNLWACSSRPAVNLDCTAYCWVAVVLLNLCERLFLLYKVEIFMIIEKLREEVCVMNAWPIANAQWIIINTVASTVERRTVWFWVGLSCTKCLVSGLLLSGCISVPGLLHSSGPSYQLRRCSWTAKTCALFSLAWQGPQASMKLGWFCGEILILSVGQTMGL